MTAHVKVLLGLLEDACSVLQPFTLVVSANTLVYDGARYAPAPQQAPDPSALAWWSTLKTAIALLDEQTRLTRGQLRYLRDSLCGGMGSFNDFSLEESRWGDRAVSANGQLDRIRESISLELNRLAHTVA